MKNKEKYANEIVEIAINGSVPAIDIRTMKLCRCVGLTCDKCYFNEENYPYYFDNCTKSINDWANSEYVEPKEFTEHDKSVLRALDKVEWVAKDRNGEVYGFRNKPYKSTDIWKSDSIIDSIFLSGYSSCEFKAIKWEDTEPTSRKEILGEEK